MTILLELHLTVACTSTSQADGIIDTVTNLASTIGTALNLPTVLQGGAREVEATPAPAPDRSAN